MVLGCHFLRSGVAADGGGCVSTGFGVSGLRDLLSCGLGGSFFRWREWWVLAAIFCAPEREAEGWWLWLRGSERLGLGWCSRGPSTVPLSTRLHFAQGASLRMTGFWVVGRISWTGLVSMVGVVRPLALRTPSRRSSATSLMAMSSRAALLGVLPSMLLQKGQPTARIFSDVSPAAVARVWLGFVESGCRMIRSSPGSSSFQNWAPPAPQQKEFSRLRGSSGVLFERMWRRLRGAS